MPKRLTVLGVIGLILLLVLIQRFQQPARPTVFANMSFEQAQAAAGAEKKLLVVDFGAGWCGPCREMDRSTWTSPVLTSWLSEHAVAIKVDIDEDPGRTRAFGVAAVPTVVAMSGTKEVGRWTGLMSAEELVERLRGAGGR